MTDHRVGNIRASYELSQQKIDDAVDPLEVVALLKKKIFLTC